MGQTERTSDVRIREMTAADLPAVAAIERACFSRPWSERGFADAIAQPGNLFLVAETGDGRVAAYCGLYTAADEGEITNVAVTESARERGIGSSLVAAICQEAKRRGVSRIFLEVRRSNDAAGKLYAKAGFAECGVRKNFYEFPSEDAIVMTLQMKNVSGTHGAEN